MLGYIDGLCVDSCELQDCLTETNTLTFDVDKYVYQNGIIKKSNYYDYLDDNIYLFLEGIGYFRANKPVIEVNGDKEVKHVTAYSCDTELKKKYLRGFKVNCGVPDSQEYLVKDSYGNAININPYTKLPIDYITVYNHYPSTLLSYKEELHEHGFIDNSAIMNPNIKKILINLVNEVPRIQSHINYIKQDDNTNTWIPEIISYISIVKANFDPDSNEQIITVTNLLDGIDTLINFYQKYGEQLSLLDLVIEKTDNLWTVDASKINPIISKKKFTFDIDEQDIYSFLTQDFSYSSMCIIDFNLIERKIGLKMMDEDSGIDEIGEDTGVYIGFRNLLNSLNITCSEDSIITKFYVKGADNLGINYVNFGGDNSDYIINLDYYVNASDCNGNLLFVDDEFRKKYNIWKEKCDSKREIYINHTKKHNSTIDKINRIKYLLPNDDLDVDYTTYSLEELKEAKTSYTNALLMIDTMYKNEFNKEEIIDEEIKNTMYWYDYYAYKFIIIPNIDIAILRLEKINNNELPIDIKQYDYWKYEWTLFGLKELEAKLSTWQEVAKLYSEYAKEYSENENSSHYNESEYISKHSIYIAYTSIVPIEKNIISGRLNEIGIIPKCLEEINQRKEAINIIQEEQDKLLAELENIRLEVSLENNFTENDLKVISLLTHEGNYQNDNIVVTSLDNLQTTVDIQNNLFKEAKKRLSIESVPQLTFSAELDNLFQLEDFQPIANSIRTGNFIRISIGRSDDYYTKLRIVKLLYNPILSCDMHRNSNLKLEFTNMIYTENRLFDFTYFFQSKNSSSRTSSGTSSGSSGNFGNTNIQISNNILNALLKTNNFGMAVNSAMVDNLNANNGIFNTLLTKIITIGDAASGNTTINGKSLKTGWIASSNYNGIDGAVNNTEGTIVNLESGFFNFNNMLIYDNDGFKFKGDISADQIISGILKSSNAEWGKEGSLIDLNSGTFSLGAGKLNFNGTDLKVEGEINATGGSFAGNILSKGTISGGIIDGTEIKGGSIDGAMIISTGDGSTIITGGKLETNNISITGGEITMPTAWDNGYSEFSKRFNIDKNGLSFKTYGADVMDVRSIDMFITHDSLGMPQITFNGYSTTASESYIYTSITGTKFSSRGAQTMTSLYDYAWEWELGSNFKHTGCYRESSLLDKRTLYVGKDGKISAASSSRRYKQDISPINKNIFDVHGIYSLPVIQYRYDKQHGGGDNSQLHIGFIAEDVAKYFPPAARYNKDKINVDTWEISDMFPAVVKLIQEQHHELEEQRNTIKEQNEKINQLEKRLENIERSINI